MRLGMDFFSKRVIFATGEKIIRLKDEKWALIVGLSLGHHHKHQHKRGPHSLPKVCVQKGKLREAAQVMDRRPINQLHHSQFLLLVPTKAEAF
jgi:hypothetical protein